MHQLGQSAEVSLRPRIGLFNCKLLFVIAVLFLGPSLVAGVAVVVGVLAVLALGGPVDEAEGFGDLGVNAGNLFATPNAPRNDASLWRRKRRKKDKTL